MRAAPRSFTIAHPPAERAISHMRARRLVSLFVVIAALVAVPAANAHAASTPGVTLSVANGYLTIVDDPGDAATVQIGSNEISGNDVVWIAGNWRWGSGVDDCYMLWDIHATSWALWCQDATQGVVLALGDGNDTVNTLPGKGFAHQTALLGDGNDVYVGGNGVDQVWGEGGNDAITTMGGNDELHGQVGDDVMAGGDGDDLLMGGAGADIMNAGAPGTGHDTVSYDDSVTPVTAKLGGGDGGNVTGKSNDGDSFSGSVGKVVGSKHG